MANGNWNFTGEKNKDWREENKRFRALVDMMEDPQAGTIQGIESGHSEIDTLINENAMNNLFKHLNSSPNALRATANKFGLTNPSESVDEMANRMFPVQQRKRTSILEKIANSPVGDIQNPIRSLLKGVGLSSRDNQSIGAEIKEHMANKKREKEVESILQNYVKGLMDERAIPGSYQR